MLPQERMSLEEMMTIIVKDKYDSKRSMNQQDIEITNVCTPIQSGNVVVGSIEVKSGDDIETVFLRPR